MKKKLKKYIKINLLNKNTFLFHFLLEEKRFPPEVVVEETKGKWELSGDIFGSGDSGQAVVYKIKSRLPPYEQAALKSFQKKFPKEGPSRTYREIIAMDLLKGLLHIDKNTTLFETRFLLKRKISE
jgi:hypothetical protein